MSNQLVPRTPIITATALVDWNSQVHALTLPDKVDEQILADRTLSYVGKIVSKTLSLMSPSGRFDVTLRVYSGWHHGFKVTNRKKALVKSAAAYNNISVKPNVVIRPDIEFGDRLISGRQSRAHVRLGIHVANTMRPALRDSRRFEEKMVDTSIAADLVDLAHNERERWLLLIGEDDDLIPPLIVADGIRSSKDGKVIIIRQRSQTPFYHIDDLGSGPIDVSVAI